MECNKDEAIRAKKMAENKMTNNDFEGARKLVLKARQLFPELDNISQMLTVCDVHCSAQRKMHAAEKDLYGILQVESVADEATIKKQYRKLALVLHPDKNKFPGAEAAFKLIGEANMILSDKATRSLHDMKCREPARSTISRPQNHHGSQNRNQHYSVPSSHFSGMNHHQQSQSDTNGRPSFWTYCPFCNIKYMYYQDIVNRPVRCQHCMKLFIAYDIEAQREARAPHAQHAGVQNVNLGSNSGQSAQRAGQFASHFAHQTGSTSGVQSAQGTRRENVEVGGGSRTKTEEHGNTKAQDGKAEKPREARVSKDSNVKKSRKMVVESSDSSEAEITFKGTSVNPSAGSHRRSSRKRPNVSYSEEAGNHLSPTKRSKLSGDVEDAQKEEFPRDKVCNTSENIKKDVSKSKASAQKEEVPSKANPETEDDSEPVFIDCPDLEFSNFDQDKEERCFAADQIWACYDTNDGMPRFYAQIKKVYSNGFKLRITWLEADPENHLEIIWAEGLPVACGRFVRGDTEETKDRLMFSHQMVFEKGKGRGSYVIYPKKGEIWALFKDWDIKWSDDPKSRKKFKIDIVEILSDFDNDNGVLVAYMVKVEGFVSLFQRTSRARLAEHRIPSSELFRFSHRIPSVKLTGTERADVPVGSCELDTASLPEDLDRYYFPNKKPINTSCLQSPDAKVKPGSGLVNTPKKPVKSDGKNENDKGMFNLRRSPRGLKGNLEQSNGVDDVNTRSNVFRKSPELSSPSGGKESKLVIHDFNADKQNQKFHELEIWALRRSKDGKNPRRYAQIKKIESSPLRIHADLLESCNSKPIACGLFKASFGRRQIFPPDSFSYRVSAEVNGKNRFNIYPKEKEIWALYNKQDSNDSGECDFVEILESHEHMIKVLSLSRVPGYKSVFRACEIQNSKTRVLEIPHAEINRFAYRVPAFLLTVEQDGLLRGCWELDLEEVPGLPPKPNVAVTLHFEERRK